MDPITIGAYIEIAGKLSSIIGGIVAQLRAGGVSEEQIAAITSDYDNRIARREAESAEPTDN